MGNLINITFQSFLRIILLILRYIIRKLFVLDFEDEDNQDAKKEVEIVFNP